jgi:hypothetical protein
VEAEGAGRRLPAPCSSPPELLLHPERLRARRDLRVALAPGPSFVIVKTGGLTLYRGDDPDCAPRVFAAGSGFVDERGDAHLVRDEGIIETVVYVTSLIAEGAIRRIDEADSGTCPS